MITTIFFDFDGVLTADSNGSVTTFTYLAAELNLPKEELMDQFRRLSGDVYAGKESLDMILEEFSDHIGAKVTMDMMEEAFAATRTYEEMFALCKELEGDYQLGIITDNIAERVDYLRKQMDLDALFNPIIASGYVGAFKSGHRIFEIACEQAGCDPKEAAFIDNSAKNLVASADLGMKTYHFDDEKRDMGALRNQFIEWGIRV